MLVANVVRRSRCGHGLLSADFFTDCLRRFCWHDACGANGKRSLGGGCAFCASVGGFSDENNADFGAFVSYCVSGVPKDEKYKPYILK